MSTGVPPRARRDGGRKIGKGTRRKPGGPPTSPLGRRITGGARIQISKQGQGERQGKSRKKHFWGGMEYHGPLVDSTRKR